MRINLAPKYVEPKLFQGIFWGVLLSSPFWLAVIFEAWRHR